MREVSLFAQAAKPSSLVRALALRNMPLREVTPVTSHLSTPETVVSWEAVVLSSLRPRKFSNEVTLLVIFMPEPSKVMMLV